VTGTVHLARLAAPPDDARRGLYWRGPAVWDPAGGGLWQPAGSTVDLGTWFNAAPLGWWRSLLPGSEVDLEVRGTGELTVTTLDASGARRSDVVEVTDTTRIRPPDDALWCWVTWRSGSQPAWLQALTWSAPAIDADPTARVTAVVPSYRRELEALAQVRRLLDPVLDDVVARVVLVDQAGTLAATPGMAETAERAGQRLLLCQQANLGGSGGFARGLLEATAFPDDAVLLLDDDAAIDPEGLRRMVVLSHRCAAAGRPTVLGSPLFAVERPTTLVALAEGIRPFGFRWGATDGLRAPTDLADSGPADWRFARPDARTDYVGWWGAVLPPGAPADLGLPAPYFLKWDDAEYGLRARRAGFRLCVVPGTGAWHPAWAAKATLGSWSAMPLHRNRLATAAAYGAGRSVLADSLVHQIKHVLSLQYDTADLWDLGLAEVLAGPGWMGNGASGTRERAEGTAPGRSGSVLPAGTVPAVQPPPRGVFAQVSAGAAALLGLVRPNRLRDVVAVDADRFHWSAALGRDALVLVGSDRTLVRDPRRARHTLIRTVAGHARAAARWPALIRRYQAALPAGATAARWRLVLDLTPADDLRRAEDGR
jgi:galactofuranosylgalactofuranosylrhamnosyl-N-acetylglucosaminyl-diphospho-decaprenol beta-1,5/1,6-galactofuranosyltransferase